jgi:hypothetical protein
VPTKAPTFRPSTVRTPTQIRAEYDARRYNLPWRAWYGTARWRATREAQLSLQPLCCMCLEADIVTEATVCDHVEPHRGNEDLFWSGPFQSLCSHHHNSTKQREENAHDKDQRWLGT